MKKIIAALMLSTAAFTSQAASPCPQIEFAELQTYTTKELEDLAMKYVALSVANMGGIGQRAIESQNCDEQFVRIQRIVNARAAQEKQKAN